MYEKQIYRGVLLAVLYAVFFGAQFAQASSNISSNAQKHWAWNDVIGWIDFRYEGNPNVYVSDDELTGYASSSVGFIALNCDHSNPNADVSLCANAGNFKVSNDGSGKLAGWAWSDAIGWISFCGNTGSGSLWNTLTGRWECPAGPSYWVNIETTQTTPGSYPGDVAGWAWNDAVGWISFCGVSGSTNVSILVNGKWQCPQNYSYKVNTDWPSPTPGAYLISEIFDTCPQANANSANCGASLNFIRWRGAPPIGAPSGKKASYVEFQIASSNCANGASNYTSATHPNDPSCDAGTWDASAHPNSTFCNTTGTYGANSCFFGPGENVNDTYAVDDFDPDDPTGTVSSLMFVTDQIHVNKRYFRYKIFLKECTYKDGCPLPQTPTVEDVIINWSP